MRYTYLAACIGSTLISLVLYCRASPANRPVILRVGAVTALTGLAEPLFIPDYWNPPTLFDLGQRTGFDIESFMFNFSAGFNAAAIYGALRTWGHGGVAAAERRGSRDRYHRTSSKPRICRSLDRCAASACPKRLLIWSSP